MADKKRNNLLWIVLGGTLLGVVANAFLGGDSETTVSKPKKKVTSQPIADANGVLKSDFDVSFPVLAVNPRDAFRPLIARSATLPGALGPGMKFPTGIPPELADGDPNWAFTGTVAVNGVNQALVENKVTGDGDFILAGQHWKSSTVVSIAGDELYLKGPTGSVIKVLVEADSEALQAQALANASESNPSRAAGPNLAPVAPPISGPIGSGLSVTPDASVPTSVMPMAPVTVNPAGNGGRRGGRRGRGGGSNQGNAQTGVGAGK